MMEISKAVLNSQLFGVIIGAVLAFFATLLTTRFQLKYAGKIRTKELMAEKRLPLLQESYKRMKDLETKVMQESPVSMNSAVKEIANQQEWFFINQMYLPVEFGNVWTQIRTKIFQFDILNGGQPRGSKRLDELDNDVTDLLKKALTIIYKEFGREPLSGEVDGLEKKKTPTS